MPVTPESLAAGKKAYETFCAACHGNRAQGAVKAGTAMSIIADSGGKQPSDLSDAQWDHGDSDAAIYEAIRRGVPSSMMPAWQGSIPDEDIWNIVNYLRSLAVR